MGLGNRVRAARKARGWALDDMCSLIADEGGGVLTPGTLSRLEGESRPGEPRVWGHMWRILGLPLRELYEGLGLPLAEDLPAGVVGEALAVMSTMSDPEQRHVLAFARHSRVILASSQIAESVTPPLDKGIPAGVEHKSEREERGRWGEEDVRRELGGGSGRDAPGGAVHPAGEISSEPSPAESNALRGSGDLEGSV
jgi:hypothetical protein